jgi:hypothetical protein
VAECVLLTQLLILQSGKTDDHKGMSTQRFPTMQSMLVVMGNMVQALEQVITDASD